MPDTVEARRMELDARVHQGHALYALSHLALVHQSGALRDRAHYVEAADQFANQMQVLSYRGHTLGIKAMWLLDEGDVDASVDCMAESLAIINQTGSAVVPTYCNKMLSSHKPR